MNNTDIEKDCTVIFYWSDGDLEVDTNLKWLLQRLNEKTLWLYLDSKQPNTHVVVINMDKVYHINIKIWNFAGKNDN